MTKLNTRILALGFGAALLMAGCGGGTSDETPTPPPTLVPTPTADETQQPTEPPTDDAIEPTQDAAAPELPLLALGAVEVALAHTPGAVVEIDHERNQWEVVILTEDGTGIELSIDIASGEVLREESESLSPEQTSAPTITAREAIEIALGEVPGELWDLDLDTEQGIVVWEAELTDEAGVNWEIYIDAETGAIVKVEQDD
ncbi:MAG: PepSY domain-containing protein [Ruaniaceae bacterium]|nr:PepSY domain-containing protein [Ruaniaceae bacterium]